VDLQADTNYFNGQLVINQPAQFSIDQGIRSSYLSKQVLLGMAMSVRANSIGMMYQTASGKNGSYVVVDRKFSYLPLLWGKDGRPVAVYEVVEEIEAILDFGELRSRFPTLSYTQVTATIGFLRTLAQFNSKNKEIDALQDEEIENGKPFQDAVKQAMGDKEAVRVLAPL